MEPAISVTALLSGKVTPFAQASLKCNINDELLLAYGALNIVTLADGGVTPSKITCSIYVGMRVGVRG
mgnify:CR=1 FL=1